MQRDKKKSLPRRCPSNFISVNKRAHKRFASPCHIQNKYTLARLIPYNALQQNARAGFARAQILCIRAYAHRAMHFCLVNKLIRYITIIIINSVRRGRRRIGGN
jgi:hypothetical protein